MLKENQNNFKNPSSENQIFGFVAKVLYTFCDLFIFACCTDLQEQYKSSSSSAIQIKYSLLHFVLHCILYLPFQSCPSSLAAFFRPWETWIAFRAGTYSCLGDNCSLLLKLCLCYAVYLMILLKLQYCHFTFFPSVLHYLNCCTWYWKLEDCYQFRKRVLNGKD